MNEETTYTAISPNGVTDFIYADTMVEAYTQARNEYGPGVLIRESFYDEWTCGDEESGNCWYTNDGRHVWKGGIDCTECGNNYKPTEINNHGNGEFFCQLCQ